METLLENRSSIDVGLANWIDPPKVLRALRRIVRVPDGWKIRRLRVARVFPARSAGFGAQYDVALANGDKVVRGAIFLSPLKGLPARRSNRLVLRRDRALRFSGLATCIAGDRMLLHTPDRDPAMPRVREAISASIMAPRLKIGRPLRCWVLSYRPGRRCTIAYRNDRNDGAYVVGKLYSNGLAMRVPTLQRRLRASLAARESTFRLPRIVHRLPEFGMVVSEGIPTIPHVLEAESLDRAIAAGRVLAAVHSARMLPNDVFTAADELTALDRWLNLARGLGRMSRTANHLRQWLDRARRENTPGRSSFLHRDFYDGQLLRTDDGWALVDFDTATAGDRELDVANYLAHVLWHYVRAGRSATGVPKAGQAFLSSYIAHAGRARLCGARLRFYLVASLVRVAIIHSLRTGEEPAARRLLNVARRWSAPNAVARALTGLGGKP